MDAILVELWLVQTVLKMLLAQSLDMRSIQSTTDSVVMSFKATVAHMRKGCIHDPPLLLHFCLVLVHPCVSLEREIQVLSRTQVRLS